MQWNDLDVTKIDHFTQKDSICRGNVSNPCPRVLPYHGSIEVRSFHTEISKVAHGAEKPSVFRLTKQDWIFEISNFWCTLDKNCR